MTRASKIWSIYIGIADNVHKGEADIVPVIKLGYWPEEVEQEWLSRDKLWPDDITKHCVASDGCYLVPRDLRDEDRKGTWKVSFVNAEIQLSSLWSKEQKLVYFLAKAVYYKRIMPLNDRDVFKETKTKETELSSYFLKTAMMYLCEDHPPNDNFWSHANEAASHLLQTLARNLKQGHQPNYFFPNVNLLENSSRVRLQEAVRVLETVKFNPAAELAEVITELVERIETAYSYVQIVVFAISSFSHDRVHDRQTCIDICKYFSSTTSTDHTIKSNCLIV